MIKDTLGIVGVGAFGTLMVHHLAKHFPLVLHDPHKNIETLARDKSCRQGTLEDIASCPIIILSVPVQSLETVLRALAPHLKPGTLVMDVASIKIGPAKLMRDLLPDHVDIVGTHPLFGPQSGKNGIQGLNVALCAIRSTRAGCVKDFLTHKLQLNVFDISPEDHDRQMAYVQGLTHLIAKVIVSLDLPPFQLTTKTFDYMNSMVEMVRYDSDELFRAIERDNPFASEAKDAFFSAARRLEERLAKK